MKRLAHEVPGIQSSLYRPLTAHDEKTIADAAFEVLERSGVVVYSDVAFEAFEKAGAIADASSRIVRLPRALVEDAID